MGLQPKPFSETEKARLRPYNIGRNIAKYSATALMVGGGIALIAAVNIPAGVALLAVTGLGQGSIMGGGIRYEDEFHMRDFVAAPWTQKQSFVAGLQRGLKDNPFKIGVTNATLLPLLALVAPNAIREARREAKKTTEPASRAKVQAVVAEPSISVVPEPANILREKFDKPYQQKPSEVISGYNASGPSLDP
jgi:hypothetical protein